MGQNTPPNNLSGLVNSDRFSQGDWEGQDDQDETAVCNLYRQSLILCGYSVTENRKKMLNYSKRKKAVKTNINIFL